MSLIPSPKLNIYVPLEVETPPLEPNLPIRFLMALVSVLMPSPTELIRTIFSFLISKAETIKLKSGEFVELSDNLYVKMRDDGVIEIYELTE